MLLVTGNMLVTEKNAEATFMSNVAVFLNSKATKEEIRIAGIKLSAAH